MRDYETIIKINREMINTLLDTPVILYKINIDLTETNSYGEAKSKVWYTPVQVPCLIERQEPISTNNLQTVDIDQECSFMFLREELKIRQIYPEKGDIVYFDSQYYEIDTIAETNLWAGRVEHKYSIICSAHLTRTTTLQLDKPVI